MFTGRCTCKQSTSWFCWSFVVEIQAIDAQHSKKESHESWTPPTPKCRKPVRRTARSLLLCFQISPNSLRAFSTASSLERRGQRKNAISCYRSSICAARHKKLGFSRRAATETSTKNCMKFAPVYLHVYVFSKVPVNKKPDNAQA